MPRKPKATSPNANTAGASIRELVPVGNIELTQNATDISESMDIPSQYALKLPATKPERMLSDAPPSRELVTISRTCEEWVEVKTFTNSGMTAPASVPQLMTVANFHQSELSPPMSGIMKALTI